nr:ribonuclease H-like domain-containing protein [Tanacetum cinerariifolium]
KETSRTRIVQETLHINFLENKPYIVRTGPEWLFDIDTLTQSMNYQPVVTENQPNKNAAGPNPTNNTNSFNTASPFDTAVSPNFRIDGKSSFVDPSNYPDDLDMPALEDIVYSDAEEDVCVEANFSNLETNISVSPFPTSRVHKDYPVTQIIDDLTLAHQTRSMKRMVKEHGGMNQINDKDFHTSYASFMGFMVYQMDVKSAFLYETIEEKVYVCQPLGFEDPDYPDKVYNVVKALYGWHQAPRAWKFGLTYVKSASTPIETEKPLLKDPDGEDVDVHIYRLMIGSLMYLTSSRLDIMFDICACARFQVTPKTVVATSSTKAEYVAAASCCAHVLWIQNQLLDYGSPSIGFMRPFGCPVTILNTLDPLGKFDRKDDERFLVGYSINCKAYRVFNSRTKIVQETLHINFLENKLNVERIGPKWLFDIDTLTMSMNYQPAVAGNQPNDNAD